MAETFWERAGRNIGQWLGVAGKSEYAEDLAERRRYYHGKQKKPLAVKRGADYNILTNLSGLAVDRANAMLFAGGLEFEYEDPESAEAMYLDTLWNANHRPKWQLLLSNDGEID